MKKIYILFFLVVVILIFSQFSCKSPTAPKQNNLPDTTSQNFKWQKYYFGVGGYTVLNDVAIVNDSDIWAVGSIYLNDSTGKPETAPHNAINWDGNNWIIKRIKTNACGGVVYPPVQAIFAFSSNDILFAHIDGSISYYDGKEFTNDCSLITQLNGSANKIWGKSKNDFYVVSGNGFIAHYQNGSWQKIESGTGMNISDIWGAANTQTGKTEILAVASYPDTSAQRKIFQINGTIASEISSSGINWDLRSVWFKPQSHYFVAGTGIYDKHLLSDGIWSNQYFNITNYYINCIRGNDVNDVVAVGSFGEVIHWNGVRWKSFMEETQLNSGAYGAIAVKGNLVIAVGLDSGKAVILKGTR